MDASGVPPLTPSERAFEVLLAQLTAGDTGAGAAPPTAAEPLARLDAASFVRELFSRRDRYLERGRFSGIEDRAEFRTKIVGVTFESRQDVVAGLRAGDPLTLRREPENPYDSAAIAVGVGVLALGYLRREIAERLAPVIDGGAGYEAAVLDVTGGGGKSVGVNVVVRRTSAPSPRPVAEPRRDGDVRRALLGDRTPHLAQRAVVARVDAGDSMLAVMGTGRGKSFCFQDVAGRRALERGEKTLVMYPLRALANDQHAALLRTLAPLGVRVFRANGAIDAEERRALAASLADGAWDLLLATPEFARFHRAEFMRACNRPSLVVIDEAHHVFDSRHRPSYGSLGAFVREIGAPQTLALTATAGEGAFAAILRDFGIRRWIVDPTVRANLRLVDARNAKDKLAYVRTIADAGTKAILYCNSRAEATKLAERLRETHGDVVAFYHAGVGAEERLRIEAFFRSGELRVVVATSAFGEGIDLPDVRDVILYHLNFNFTEFNQQAGRAGRDGADARIHLLYGESDRRINEFILARGAPSLDVLRELYRSLRRLATEDVLRLPYEEIARILDLDRVSGATVGAAVRIFEEGGLVTCGSDDEGAYVRFSSPVGKVDLTQTTRYAEGEAERDAFARFAALALDADAASLQQIVDRPIYPDGIPLEC